METSKKQPVTQRKIFSESGRVAKSQRRVLVQLALLFIVPLSLATTLYFALIKPQIYKETTNPYDPTSLSKLDIFLFLGHNLVALIFSIFATSSITFTAFNGFNDEPVKLKVAIKSISASFSRLLATTVLTHAIVFVVAFLFDLAIMIFIGFMTQSAASKDFIFFFLELNYFFLASTVVVVESKWGLEALKLSKALIKGKRWLPFTLLLVLGIYNMIFGVSVTGLISRSLSKGTNHFNSSSLLVMLVLILVNTCLASIGQLFILVATGVLCTCCKESQRSDEYFSLVVNEEKVDTVV